MKYWIFHFIDKYAGIPIIFAASLLKSGIKKTALSKLSSILVVKFTMLGDTILLVPALRALRKAHPEAKIVMLCSPVNIEILKNCPYVDDLIVVDPYNILNPFKILKLLRDLRSASFDLAIDFEQWFRFSAIITFLSGAKLSAGFKTGGQARERLFDIKIEHENKRHEVECYFDVLEKLGIESLEKGLELWIPEQARLEARNKIAELLFSEDDEFVVVHPGSSHWPQKQWPADRYAKLCEELSVARNKKVILSGSASEVPLINEIIGKVTDKKNLYSLGGKLSVLALAALLKRSAFLVCGNTGVMHIACAVGTKVLLINGPVSAVKWGPWSENNIVLNAKQTCAPCVYLGFEYRCSTNRCMLDITVEDALAGALKLMKKEKNR